MEVIEINEENKQEEKVFITYNITNHAQERYAQRIVGKDNMTDIRTYINAHKNDIKKWINELIHYGTMIYEGKLRDYSLSQVFYKDFWVIIVDPKQRNVVTLYKIDLGDNEVNELFVTKIMQKINDKQNYLEKTKESAEKNIIEYQKIIDDNNLDIKKWQSMIKSLQQVNQSYEILIKNSNLEIRKVESEISDLVDKLVARKIF